MRAEYQHPWLNDSYFPWGLSMPTAKTARGRPRGTGLDDRAVLKSVIELIATHPEMKPTTAIRSVGVSDPSAIRRLRDKFHLTQRSLKTVSAKRRAESETQPPARVMAMRNSTQNVREATLKADPEQRTPTAKRASPRSPVKRQTAAAVVEAPTQQAASEQSPLSWFALWAELSLQSISASYSAHWIIYENVLLSPPVTVAFGTHAELTEFAAAWCATSPPSSKAVH